jgi:hypothetical protein
MTPADTIERDGVPAATAAPFRHPNRPKKWLNRRAQAKRYQKSKRTIERWGRDPEMGMPPETWFNGTPHRTEEELEIWDMTRPRESAAARRPDPIPPRRIARKLHETPPPKLGAQEAARRGK